MEKLSLNDVNRLMSQAILSKDDLRTIVDYFLRQADKKYITIKASDRQNEISKEAAYTDARTWSFISEILKGDDILETNHQDINININQMQNNDMEIEQSQQNPLSQHARVLRACTTNDETIQKQKFYHIFMETWYSKTDNQRMHLSAYDQSKLPNFLCHNNIDSKCISIEQSKGILADKSYSDLEIIQDIVFFDNHLQRFAKTLRWLQTQCLLYTPFDPELQRNSQSNYYNQSNQMVSEINWVSDKNTDEQLICAVQLLKRGEHLSACRFMKEKKMKYPLELLDSVFPYHDYQLGDSNDPIRLQQNIVLSEIKNAFMLDVFTSSANQDALTDRLSYYKQNQFNSNELFDKSIGNQNWLESLRTAYAGSFNKTTKGEQAYFGYLSSNYEVLAKLIENSNHHNNWYEELWAAVKNLYVNEILKRFLVIRSLLNESIEQFYPRNNVIHENVRKQMKNNNGNDNNYIISFEDSPLENYRKITLNQGIERDIYAELRDFMIRSQPNNIESNNSNNNRYGTSPALIQQLLLAYLKPPHLVAQQSISPWHSLFIQLANNHHHSSNLSPSVYEFNAKLGFVLYHSQYVLQKDASFYGNFIEIIKNHVKELIIQDRASEVVVFLKSIPDEREICSLMAMYMAQKRSDPERKHLKAEMIKYGYSESTIQAILQELVTRSFSNQESSDLDSTVIDGLRMFIKSAYNLKTKTNSQPNGLHICVQHFLIAARTFLQTEKLTLYTIMRQDKVIAQVIQDYVQLAKIQLHDQFDEVNIQEIDPFLHEIAGYDGIISCHQLLDGLKTVHVIARSYNQVQKQQSEFDSQTIKAGAFVDQCRQTFFKTNNVTRKRYILIDNEIQFEEKALMEFNPHQMTQLTQQEITAHYLKKAIVKSIETAGIYPIFNQIGQLLSMYFSQNYSAYALFSHDDQEAILKNSQKVLISSPSYISTIYAM